MAYLHLCACFIISLWILVSKSNCSLSFIIFMKYLITLYIMVVNIIFLLLFSQTCSLIWGKKQCFFCFVALVLICSYNPRWYNKNSYLGEMVKVLYGWDSQTISLYLLCSLEISVWPNTGSVSWAAFIWTTFLSRYLFRNSRTETHILMV